MRHLWIGIAMMGFSFAQKKEDELNKQFLEIESWEQNPVPQP